MKLNLSRIVLLSTLLLLSACMGPKTPQEVTEAFWAAVIADHGEDAVRYSTLDKVEEYDAFGQKWTGFHHSLGKVEIEGEQATVKVKLSSPASSGQDDRKVTTYLVLHNEEWKIDYQRTGEVLRGGVLGKLFGDLSKLGDNLSKQFNNTATEFNAEMERMGKEFEALSNSLNQQANTELEKYAEELRNEIDKLAESVRRALEQHKRELSHDDRRVLTEVAVDLQQQHDNLDHPTMQSISTSSRDIGKAQQRLQGIDDDAIRDYQQQWSEWSKRLKGEMQRFLDALNADDRG